MPVYGDIFQQIVGQTVVQNDSLGGNFESHLLRFLPTGFSLLHRDNSVISPLTFPGQAAQMLPPVLKEKQHHLLAHLMNTIVTGV